MVEVKRPQMACTLTGKPHSAKLTLEKTQFTIPAALESRIMNSWRQKEEIFMGHPAEKIIAEALQLPTPLRALVAERLIESLDLEESGEVAPEWREEIVRRCREIDEEMVELIPAETVLARAYATLK